MEVIDPKSAKAFSVSEGQTFRIVDIEGSQVADLVGFTAGDHAESLSQGRTRLNNWKLGLEVGDPLYSNRNREMFTLLEDTVGAHDLLFPPCNAYLYEHTFDQPGRTGCHDHLSAALAEHGISPDQVTDTLNVFMNTHIDDAGAMVIDPPLSKAGDHIRLRANFDCLIGVSACAEDISECNGRNCTSIGVELD
jgi:uncharacterized protein YcgI (DUF1989 family)